MIKIQYALLSRFPKGSVLLCINADEGSKFAH